MRKPEAPTGIHKLGLEMAAKHMYMHVAVCVCMRLQAFPCVCVCVRACL